MVMPLLRLMNNHKFDLIEELIDFVDQILEVRITRFILMCS